MKQPGSAQEYPSLAVLVFQSFYLNMWNLFNSDVLWQIHLYFCCRIWKCFTLFIVSTSSAAAATIYDDCWCRSDEHM